MVEQQFNMMRLHWDALRETFAKWRKGDEGVTTLEMVIIGGFLIAAAGALVVLLNTVWTNNKGHIVNNGTITT
jgi:hypothetical protein